MARPFEPDPEWAGVTLGANALTFTFQTLLVINLVLLVFTTYFLTRRPVLMHLREIYFINSSSFKRAWYLVIAGMTLFIFARVAGGIATPQASVDPRILIFEVAFAALVMAAFLELVFVFRRYFPYIKASDKKVQQHIQEDLRRGVLRLDDKENTDIDVSIAGDIYQGRQQLGPHVGLAHYRGVVLGVTQYMEQRFGELGDAMLYAVGRQTGRKAATGIQADSAQIQQGGPDLLLEEFLHALRGSAVGMPTIVQNTGTGLTVKLDECAVCAGIRPTGTTECHYLTGLFTGLMETAWQKPVNSTEVRCSAKGDTYCEFQIDAA